jgi:DNA-binding SARP family transcriptional activator
LEEHKSTYPLIHNKITAPHYVTPTLRRGRLVDWLHERAGCRALVLAAEAGYGKTTLLWQWEREVDFPCYWYKLDRNDRDWTLHISYIVEAVSQRHPGFGRRAHSVLRQMGGPGSSRPGVTAFLLAEMHERLTEPCTFIIDDWQYVASVTEVRGLWNQILRDAPPTCRFVFASRGKPQLQFARFKTHSGYGELRTDDLRLTESEIAELFRDVYRDPLTSDEVSELERRTEGWAASLQLIEVSLRERATPGERRALIESITATSDTDLYEFLAQEVLDQQSEETRNFLLSTSILQQITPDLSERLAGVHDGSRRLLQLEHAGLFTYRLDERRYRYHGLFRDFLERRLLDERSESEVVGLHIHAASYYETGEQWPLAIYHYLKAALHRQAARLMARYGEDVTSEGRLGLIDEWLQQLPPKAIRDNARLSLLFGEALGARGDWAASMTALERSREFFANKGDSRMEALAVLKESSVHNLKGEPLEGAALAKRGLELAPVEDRVLRLRLQGNVMITEGWLFSPLPDLARSLNRLIGEASSQGLEHYAAIGLHNLGIVYREIGDLEASVGALEQAARYWRQMPSSPFGDNFDLVLTLLSRGDLAGAKGWADGAAGRTKPWPRSHGEALSGTAVIHIFEGNFGDAEALLRPVLSSGADLGAASEIVAFVALEAAILGQRPREALRAMADVLRGLPRDPRLLPSSGTILAIAEHDAGDCGPECGTQIRGVVQNWRSRGGEAVAILNLLKLSSASLSHGNPVYEVVRSIRRAGELGLIRFLRWWIRRLEPFAEQIFEDPLSLDQLVLLVESDPEAWREAATRVLARASPNDRGELLAAIVRTADRKTGALLSTLAGPDIGSARSRIIRQQAPRIFLRGFGQLSAHRGGWDAQGVSVVKRRLRLLLSLLVGHAGQALPRELVLDLLWPDSHPAGAVNSLNQAIFQLRRLLDPDYKDGVSPAYVQSTVELVALDSELVRTDLDEFRRRASALPPDGLIPVVTAEGLLDLVRGEYLADARYSDWAEPLRARVHGEVRATLSLLLKSRDNDIAIRAAHTLILLDEFDELGQVALWQRLAVAGRRAAARAASDAFISKYQHEFGEDPSASTMEAALRLKTSEN